MRSVFMLVIFLLSGSSCFAWFENGHHLVAVMAFERLRPDQQIRLVEILKSHPRFAEDFALPEQVKEDNIEAIKWMVGRAGYWPDVARKGPFDRPNWHWQLGATAKIGRPEKVPASPGPCPDNATADSLELHIVQAIELNRRILKDKSKPDPERALAICWLLHLVSDGHQPCHAGSLYTEKLFPLGDAGATQLKINELHTLHGFWDGLLGAKWDAADLERRRREIEADRSAGADANERASDDPSEWLLASRSVGQKFVYTPDVIEQIETTEANGQLGVIKLSDEYGRASEELAKQRILLASVRLARVLAEALD